MKDIKMTSIKPYMIKAFCEWIGDNNDSPVLIVFKRYPELEIIEGYEEVQLSEQDDVYVIKLPIEVLNKTEFSINTKIPFTKDLIIPTNSIVAVISEKYAKIQRFEIEDSLLPKTKEDNKPQHKKPTLTIVK